MELNNDQFDDLHKNLDDIVKMSDKANRTIKTMLAKMERRRLMTEPRHSKPRIAHDLLKVKFLN